MANFNVTGEFEAGTTGTVVFRRRVWLNDNGQLIPPNEYTANIAGGPPPGFVQSLRATTEDGVDPQGWFYDVEVNVAGQEQLKGFMLLTANSDLADVFQWEQPPAPELYATKAELAALEAALGNPVTQEDVDDAVAAEAVIRDAADDALTAADTAIDARLDTEEAATTAHDARLDALEALPELPSPVGEADGDHLEILNDEWVVATPSGGGGGSGGGMLAYAELDNASIQTVSMGTTIADYDSTTLRVTFDAPASGIVFVWLSSYVRVVTGTDVELYWGVRDLSNVLAADEEAFYVGDARPGAKMTVPIRISGLTPSAEYTWKWTVKRAVATDAYSGYGGVVGPARMWVQDGTLPA